MCNYDESCSGGRRIKTTDGIKTVRFLLYSKLLHFDSAVTERLPYVHSFKRQRECPPALFYINNLIIFAVTAHRITPVTVGISIDSNVYFGLFVSFFIVRQVVEHGKCITVIIIIHTAVIIPQPF